MECHQIDNFILSRTTENYNEDYYIQSQSEMQMNTYNYYDYNSYSNRRRRDGSSGSGSIPEVRKGTKGRSLMRKMCEDCRTDAINTFGPHSIKISTLMRHASSQKNQFFHYMEEDKTGAVFSHYQQTWEVRRKRKDQFHPAYVYSRTENDPNPEFMLIHSDFSAQTYEWDLENGESPTWVFVQRTGDCKRSHKTSGVAKPTGQKSNNKCCIKSYLDPVKRMWKQKLVRITCRLKH